MGVFPPNRSRYPGDISLLTALNCVKERYNQTLTRHRSHITLVRNMAHIIPALMLQSERVTDIMIKTTFVHIAMEPIYHNRNRLKTQLQNKIYWRLYLGIHPGSGLYPRTRYNDTLTLLYNPDLNNTVSDELTTIQTAITNTDVSALIGPERTYGFHWKFEYDPTITIRYTYCPEMLQLATLQEKRAYLKLTLALFRDSPPGWTT